jgi:predicted MPP superfamily phosphohydrolase
LPLRLGQGRIGRRWRRRSNPLLWKRSHDRSSFSQRYFDKFDKIADMLVLCCYHFLLLLVDCLLLRSIQRSSYTSFWFFIMLAGTGAFAALFLALALVEMIEGRSLSASANYFLQGLIGHGGFFLFASAFLMYRQRKSDGKPRRRLPSLILVFGFIYCGLAIDALLIEPTALVVREATIRTPKINKPMTLVFCSDMHGDHIIGPYERWTLQKIKEQNADLLLFGGDYIQGTTEDDWRLLKEWNLLLKEIDLHAPFGIFAIRGTLAHDWGPWKEMFENTAVIPHENTLTEQIGEIRVTFLSIDDSETPFPIPDEERENQFRIIVGHSPRYAMAAQDADLLLAGHTHGGQVQIPFWGPLLTASGDFPKKWASGLTVMPNGAVLVVSHGSGLSRGKFPRIRFWCRPDIWVIRLEPE